jgi:hypothetical protein
VNAAVAVDGDSPRLGGAAHGRGTRDPIHMIRSPYCCPPNTALSCGARLPFSPQHLRRQLQRVVLHHTLRAQQGSVVVRALQECLGREHEGSECALLAGTCAPHDRNAPAIVSTGAYRGLSGLPLPPGGTLSRMLGWREVA